MIFNVLGQIIAGLGLFLVGIKLLSTSMQQIAGPKLRQLIAKTVSKPLIASLLGLSGGFIMQKPPGVIAILTSMQSSGLINLRQAMPVIAWCNIGLAILAFFVVIPISVFVCYIIGISGFLMMFSKKKKNVIIMSALFGAALLFFGLEQMKAGTAILNGFDWFKQMILFSNQSTVIAFLIGVFVAAITQSFIAIAIMAVSLVSVGTIGELQAMMLIYGANVGVGFFRRLITSSMTGESKQLFLYQNFFRYIGTAGSVLLFYLVRIDGIPFALYISKLITGDLGTQMAIVFLFCNLPAVIFASLFQERFALFLEKKSPPTTADELIKLKHLSLANQDDNSDMLDKIDSELAVRAKLMSDYLDSARADIRPKNTPESIHQSTEIVFNEISAFESLLAGRKLAKEETERLSVTMNIQTLLQMLDDNLFKMVILVRDKVNKSLVTELKKSIESLVEVSDSLVLSLTDALMTNDEFDIVALDTITADKYIFMKNFRMKHLELSESDNSLLLGVTNYFEHIAWIVNRLANLIQKRAS